MAISHFFKKISDGNFISARTIFKSECLESKIGKPCTLCSILFMHEESPSLSHFHTNSSLDHCLKLLKKQITKPVLLLHSENLWKNLQMKKTNPGKFLHQILQYHARKKSSNSFFFHQENS